LKLNFASLAVAATLICATVSSAKADSIRGLITIRGAQVFLRPISATPAAMFVPRSLAREFPVSASIAIRTSLLDLKTDDFVVVSGSMVDADHDGLSEEIRVDAIESVGLKSLLGTWRSNKWEVVRFEDFTRMSLYRPKFRRTPSLPLSMEFHLGPLSRNPVASLKRLGFSKLKDLNYTLAPERGSSYSIFLVEKRQGIGPAPVFVGRLKIETNDGKPGLQLEIYDPKTGYASEVLSLSPVRD
jgi:hypothetical protein